MASMIFEHFAGKEVCFTEAEVRATLAKTVNGMNEFHIYKSPESFQWYLSVLVNGDYAYIWYAPGDGSAGFQAYGDDLELDSEGTTVFYISNSEEMRIYNDYVGSKERALQVVLEFMNREEWPACYEELPDCVEWEEL